MRIQPGQMISLGYDKFVRSDDVTAIEGIAEGRGRRRGKGGRCLTAPPLHGVRG